MCKSLNVLGLVYLFQIIPASAFGLGVWQVQRRSWKIELLKHSEEKTSAPPVPLPFDQEELLNLEFGKVHVRGKFEHDKVMP